MQRYFKLKVIILFAAFVMVGCSSFPKVGYSHESSYYWAGYVDIRGSEQFIEIKTKDVNQPILLYLHGGPGGSSRPWNSSFFKKLEEDFIVVHWDQRGAGKSYTGRIADEYQTIDSFVEDGLVLTNHLKETFGKDKIFLFGNSWGSVLGMHMVSKHPEAYFALAADGVVADMPNNWGVSYDLLLEKAKDENKFLAVWQLDRIGRPGDGFSMESNSQHKRYFNFLLSSTKHSVRNVPLLSNISAVQLYFSSSYNPLLIMSRIEKSSSDLMNEVYKTNLIEAIPSVDVPIYFFVGRHDFHTPYTLAKQYFNALEAPMKELVWFDDSAHAPHISENGKFVRIMRRMKEEVLKFDSQAIVLYEGDFVN